MEVHFTMFWGITSPLFSYQDKVQAKRSHTYHDKELVEGFLEYLPSNTKISHVFWQVRGMKHQHSSGTSGSPGIHHLTSLIYIVVQHDNKWTPSHSRWCLPRKEIRKSFRNNVNCKNKVPRMASVCKVKAK